MTEVGDIFAELGLSQYLQAFLDQGFDTLETILDITESDFDALGVKLGHRRKLQRKITNSRGLSSDRAFGSPSCNTPSDDRLAEELKSEGNKNEPKEGGPSHGAKRKYRRHPKSDENAPERPPSAYVVFSNKMREEVKGRNLSFTEIAKFVGENWQNLSPAEKEPYEQQAFSAKERYINELAEYKKTIEYKEYSQYLAEFKARHSNQQDPAKRPKLEAQQSTASSGTTSSGASIRGDTPAGRAYVEPSAPNTSQWPAIESQPSPQLTGLKNLTVANANSQGLPSTNSPTVLPGYRDFILNGAQALPRREEHRDDNSTPSQQLPRMTTSVTARRSSYTGPPIVDSLNPTGSLQHAHRTGQGYSHPLRLTSSESTTGRSSGSFGSSNSPVFYSPRTPLEPSLDRALPVPTLYPKKSTGSFDNQHQLPPLRPPSSSPQSTLMQHPPNGIHPIIDYPASRPPMRGYGAPNAQQVQSAEYNDPRAREYISTLSSDDNDLDPFSVLLKAGEIVNNRSGQNQPLP